MSKYLIVFCGVPGSGKTTLSKAFAEKHNFVRHSFDELRCVCYEDLIRPTVGTLQEGKSVVVDGLFNRLASRKKILDAVSNISCEKILIIMDTPIDECLQRNANRPNPLPEFIIENVHDSFEQPSIDESWDEIMYCK